MESVERVSMGGELHSQLHPSLFIMDPPLLYSSHQPSSLTTQQRHAKTPAVLLPSANQTDQGLRLPISWKHSLNIAACPVPARCAPEGSCVKSNFSWIANADFFIYSQRPWPVSIVAFSHYAATSNYHRKWKGDYDGYQRLFYLKVRYENVLSATDESRWARASKYTRRSWKRACTGSEALVWQCLVALPRSASACHSSKLCLVPALPWGLFPLHSQSNPKGQLLLAFEIHRRIFNYRCCLGCQMIQKSHQTKCFSLDVAARRKDKSLFFHFKTLVDCGYRSVSGRPVSFFFFIFFAYYAYAGRAESGANPPRVSVCVRRRTLKDHWSL